LRSSLSELISFLLSWSSLERHFQQSWGSLCSFRGLETKSEFLVSSAKAPLLLWTINSNLCDTLGSGKEQLYSQRTDEEHNLVDSEPEVAKQMRKVLLNKIEEVNRQIPGER
jgi:hypothetical protein